MNIKWQLLFSFSILATAGCMDSDRQQPGLTPPASDNADRRSHATRHYDKETEVVIVFGTEEGMFPNHWEREYDASARSLPAHRIDSSRRMIKKAMRKYPTSLVKDNLRRVYVVGELSFSGIFASGTNGAERIFIENRGIPDVEIENVFHHEFSSILFRNFESKFPIDEWSSVNPSSFRYRGSGTASVKHGHASMMFDEELHTRGFLHEYAQSSLEEDFNSIAEHLFQGSPELWKVANDYEPVGKKVSLAIDFYHMLNETFSESYFTGLLQQDATNCTFREHDHIMRRASGGFRRDGGFFVRPVLDVEVAKKFRAVSFCAGI